MLAHGCIAPSQLRRHAVNPRAEMIFEVGASAGKGPQVLPLASSAAGVGGSAGIAGPGSAGEVDGVGGGVHVYDCEVGGMVSRVFERVWLAKWSVRMRHVCHVGKYAGIPWGVGKKSTWTHPKLRSPEL